MIRLLFRIWAGSLLYIFFFKYLIKGYKNLVPNIEGPVDISVVEILVKLTVKDSIKSRIEYVPCSICH